MADLDVLAKAAEAAFDAYERALWPPTTDPSRQPYWRRWKDQSPDIQRIFTAVARAVLEAAGYELRGIKATLEQVLALERESHRLWDEAFTNIARAQPTQAERQAYIQQTYRATELHRQAVEILEAALQRAGEEG